MLSSLSGCASTIAVFRAPFETPPAPTPRASGAKTAKSYDSLGKALSKLDSKTIGEYVKRFKATTQPGGRGAKPHAVYIDASVLARQHPAWQLADALQRGIASPFPATESGRFATSIPALPGTSATSPAAPVGNDLTRIAPARGLTIAGLDEENASTRGQAQLDAFLTAWSQRQAHSRADDDVLARRALEEEVALSTQGTVDVLPLEDVSAQTALELSNLRLKLLKNLPTPPDKRAAARARIAEIEARLTAIWQAQTDAQKARMHELLVEAPARRRREGEARIQSQDLERETGESLIRQQIGREAQTLLAGVSHEAAPDPLGLQLPPTRVPLAPPARLAPLPRPGGLGNAMGLSPLAVRGLPPILAGSNTSVNATQIARLRAVAVQEANAWARRSAASEGAVWTSEKSAPDHTTRAVREFVRAQAGVGAH